MIIASEGGFMHIAASYGIPLLGLFKVASVQNWFPFKL
jgi:ADP-heptose:LPS heptosyltransferase